MVGQMPAHAGCSIGAPSIAWLTWHVCLSWTLVLDRTCEVGTPSCEDVHWPGNADSARERIARLQSDLAGLLDKFSDDDLRSTQLTRGPFKDRPLGDVVAWLNLELANDAAVIGYAHFHYAVWNRAA